MKGIGVRELYPELESFVLNWRFFYQNGTLSPLLTNAELKAVLPATMQMIVLQMTNTILGERITEIRYPANWWQAFRERWLPECLRKKFPVRYHIWKIDFLYPEIERRNIPPTIAIYSSEKSKGYPHFEGKGQKDA